MTTDYKSIKYFEGLSGLRFIAAFLVVMHHAETIRAKNNLPNFEWLGFFQNGSHAVTFFFVLSGFLITYLLLRESHKTKNVSVKNFYVRRVLRIWPLYFLIVLLGGIVVPAFLQAIHFDYTVPYTLGQTWYFFIFFLPGLVTFYYGSSILEPLWSIGVEEVFYLMWAPVFKWLRKYILGVIFFIISAKLILLLIDYYFTPGSSVYIYLLHLFKFESMAIGGWGAWFIFNRKKPLNNLKIYTLPCQLLLYGTLIMYLLFHKNIPLQGWKNITAHPGTWLALNFLYLYLIIGVAMIDKNIIKLKGRRIEHLGNISYGIYMYHLFIVFGLILFLKNVFAQLSLFAGSLLFYFLATIGIIVIAHFSKKYFENYFLSFKEKYSK